MKSELVAEYLTKLRLKSGLSYEAVAEQSKRSEATVKNLCTGKTEDPRLDTVAPIVYAMGGSIDEMYNPDKSKDEIKETSVLAMKDIYEYQLSSLKETSEAHIQNIRAHYKQHHEDLKENYEKRLADKREIIDAANAQIKELKKGNLIRNILIGSLGAIPIILFILEIMHPEHGWLRY